MNDDKRFWSIFGIVILAMLVLALLAGCSKKCYIHDPVVQKPIKIIIQDEQF